MHLLIRKTTSVMFQPIRGNDLPPDCANYLKGYLNSPISYLIHSTLKCYGEDYTITHISGVKCLHVVAAHPSAHMWTNMRDFLEDLAGFFFFFVARGRSDTQAWSQTGKIIRLHLQPASLHHFLLLLLLHFFLTPLPPPSPPPSRLPQRIFSLPHVLGHDRVNLQSTVWIKI